MAELHSSPRQASRHTGRLYERGFQFRNPDRAVLTFGPWDRVWPVGVRELERNVLRSLQDGVLIDGVISPVWGRDDTVFLDQIIVAAESHPMVTDLFSMIFYQDPLDLNHLKVKFDNAFGSQGTDVSTIVIDTSRISMAPWQKWVYFVSPFLSTVHRYSPIDHAFVSIAGSPANGKFAFILDNNLVVVRQNGLVWEAAWSVDSGPEDFAGAGSGASPLVGIGEPRGVGFLFDRAIIIGSAGARVMIPTGSATPAFAFNKVEAVEGTPFDYAVSSSRDFVFYFGYDRQLRAYAGQNSVQTIAQGEGEIGSAPVLHYSDFLSLLVVSLPEETRTLFMNVEGGRWVSNLNQGWDHITDAPASNVFGKVLGLDNRVADHVQTTLDLLPSRFSLPQLGLGEVELDDEFILEYIDVHRTSSVKPTSFDLSLFYAIRDGIQRNSVFSKPQVFDHVLRFFTDLSVKSFRIDLSVPPSVVGPLTGGPYRTDLTNEFGNIPVDATNPAAGHRGDINIFGNIEIGPSSIEFEGAGINAEGNLVLVAATEAKWIRNVGVDKVTAKLRKVKLADG